MDGAHVCSAIVTPESVTHLAPIIKRGGPPALQIAIYGAARTRARYTYFVGMVRTGEVDFFGEWVHEALPARRHNGNDQVSDALFFLLQYRLCLCALLSSGGAVTHRGVVAI